MHAKERGNEVVKRMDEEMGNNDQGACRHRETATVWVKMNERTCEN